jgi:hypothetical protein
VIGFAINSFEPDSLSGNNLTINMPVSRTKHFKGGFEFRIATCTFCRESVTRDRNIHVELCLAVQTRVLAIVFDVTLFEEGRGGGGEKEVTHVVYPREGSEDVTVRCRGRGQKGRKILSRVLVTIDGVRICNWIY